MFAVIFEVQPKPHHFDEYLRFAKVLKPELELIDGFIDNERFRSCENENHVLSLSTWRDEKALVRWRTLRAHHVVQEQGRFQVFDDYHLRVGEISADSAESPLRPAQRLDETEAGRAKAVALTELPAVDGQLATNDPVVDLGLPSVGAEGLVAQTLFESIYNPGKCLLLSAWENAGAAGRWKPKRVANDLRHREVRVIRDYGMTDRREAPQYYPPVR